MATGGALFVTATSNEELHERTMLQFLAQRQSGANKTETLVLGKGPGTPALRVPGGSVYPIGTDYKHLGFLTSERPTQQIGDRISKARKQDLQLATEISAVPFPAPLCAFYRAEFWKPSEPQFRRANTFSTGRLRKISGFLPWREKTHDQ